MRLTRPTHLQQVQAGGVLVGAHQPDQEGVCDVPKDCALVGHVFDLLGLDERRLVHDLRNMTQTAQQCTRTPLAMCSPERLVFVCQALYPRSRRPDTASAAGVTVGWYKQGVIRSHADGPD